ncbi:hypothetical protein GE21DRAFT_7014 [Neurospora crassa]|uniref:Uncharacterized protein n=2 Tax=Neurospora crassa TaxID=5141 RepID=Q1K6Q8_NEUCR|nr:hypothetical protein NCU09676 [Neurospora crassa OR74A]EAA31530.1 hypothetical protein NCU09676 [Neurospora crassa OR74A]KHE79254.1 hypothetical protein GE21DRAFT_7014 [Neurospora crassa]CAD70737.1 conserved hypothetical protein [Neurospora crassa]|eukprot:XP_960766.1 hypothetical protein NCU09676 [Neurospora crassa OR74A]
MEAAGAIDDRRIKQSFILATLISTIAGTFTTGVNLFDRVGEARRQRRQRKMDRGQNRRIKELEQRLDEAVKSKSEVEERQNSRNRNQREGDEEDLRDSLRRGGPLVQGQYDQLYSRMGPQFAQGDLLAQTQLQGQIITLQGTVIKMLEEALYTGEPPDMRKLYNASEFAREGSMRALRDQYQRLLQSAPIDRALPAPGPGPAPSYRSNRSQSRPIAPVRRTSSTPSLRDYYNTSDYDTSYRPTTTHTRARGTRGTGGSVAHSHHSHSHSQSHSHSRSPSLHSSNGIPKQLTYHNSIYCQYATYLQQSGQPLDSSLASSGVCPDCHAHLFDPVEVVQRGPWRVDKEVVTHNERTGQEDVEYRSYLLTTRFFVKCHRGGGGFACYLCSKYRERDTVCKREESLVDHVGEKHSIGEYAEDGDVRDVTR